MTAVPAPVVGLDIMTGEPSPEARALLDAIPAPSGPFEVDRLLANARRDTGLDDYGETDFVEGLERVVSSYNALPLTNMGHMQAQANLENLLRARLRIEDTIRRHPEILDRDVERPIIITGMPRTGTTHLHNLLAADGNLRFHPYWEALEPVPPPGEEGDVEPRVRRCDETLASYDVIVPHFKRMHEMFAWHAHEEINLVALSFCSMEFEAICGPTPEYAEWYAKVDRTHAYEYLKRVLKVLQHLRGGGKRWVLKSPQHLSEYRVLPKVFPDATLLVCHRDPVPVSASMATMNAYCAKESCRLGHEEVGRYWMERVEWLLRSSVQDREALEGYRVMDILFHEFITDNTTTIEKVYPFAGQPLTARTREELTTYIRDNPQGRHGRVIYDCRDFGVDPEDLRRRYAYYYERFPVRQEMKS